MIKKNSLFSCLLRVMKWPGKLINTRVRLSIGLSVAVLSLVLMAQLFHVIPNPNRLTMDARALQTETLAISGTAIIESSKDMRTFEATLQNTLRRNQDVRSIGLRDSRGNLTINIGDHDKKWHQPDNNKSNDQFMFVPVLDGKRTVGQLELCYDPLISVTSWFQSDVAKLACFLLLGTFVLFNLILYRTLKQLDPRGAVPKQVREALDILAEGLLIVDRQDRIMLANGKFGELVGVSPDKLDKLVGQKADRFPWKSSEFPWTRAIAERKPVSESIMQIVDAEGELRTFSVSASPVMTSPTTCRGVMVTFDDITTLEENKRELESARQAADAANEAKSVFLSRMSHEIRTPMNAIIGYTDILRQGGTSLQDQRKFLGTIHTSGEHLLDLINDILDLSKIEAGQMTVEKRQCRLVPILRQVIETLRIRAEQSELELNLEVDGRIPDQITTDETRLRQVLINTIGNAIKFTHDGGVTLVARMSSNQQIEFDVTDTGVGIPPEALEKIFKPFSQADDSVTRRFGGTGLGLAISKQLAEALGGGISVSSQVDVGTTFTISVDPGALDDVRWIDSASIAEEVDSASERQIEASRFESGHVLVVDDAEANRDLAAVMLKRAGLTFDLATNGQEAVESVRHARYDLVLMDMNMPVMDGLTATGIIRESGSQVPVIALTALVIEEEKQRCLSGGCDGFLPKPIRMNSLIETLSRYLPLAENMVVPPSELPSSVNDIEKGLDETLAALGIGQAEPFNTGKNRQTDADSTRLVLPEVVRCTLPMDDTELRDIFEKFVQRLYGRLPEFEQAWQTENREQLSNLAHWLAGAAGTVGLAEFVDPARELEHSDGSNPARTEELLVHILQLVERIEMPVAR